MRLWHKDLIDVLPRQQLISQWRECVLIANRIRVNGTPNHILVNKVLDYPLEQLDAYTNLIGHEMMNRGYNWNFHRYTQQRNISNQYGFIHMEVNPDDIFPSWHNDDYLRQCYYNLQEKHDRGGISDEEWEPIEHKYSQILQRS